MTHSHSVRQHWPKAQREAQTARNALDGFWRSDASSANRLDWIDVLKGLCIVLVVQHHFIKFVLPLPIAPESAAAVQLLAQVWVWFDAALGPIRMPLFFFLSGMLVCKALNRQTQSGTRRKRFDDLIWVYLIFSAIQWFSVNMAHLSAGTYHLTPLAPDAIYARSVSEFFSGLATGNASLWYLYALALYYTYSRLFSRQRVLGTLLVTGIYLALYLTKTDLGWGPNGIIHNAPYFVLGAYWSQFAIGHIRTIRWQVVLPFIAALFALTLITTLLGYSFRFFGSIVAMTVVLTLIAHYSHYLQGRSTRWLAKLGRHTLSIYVFHRIGVELFYILGESTQHTNWTSNYLLLVGWTVLAPIVAALVLSVVCANFGNRLRKMWPVLFRAPALSLPTGRKPESGDRLARRI